MKIKLDIKSLRLPEINWQKYSRVAVGVLTLIAFLYVGLLIRASQTVEPDKKYLEAKLKEFNPSNLKVSQAQLDALQANPSSKPAGRSPFDR